MYLWCNSIICHCLLNQFCFQSRSVTVSYSTPTLIVKGRWKNYSTLENWQRFLSKSVLKLTKEQSKTGDVWKRYLWYLKIFVFAHSHRWKAQYCGLSLNLSTSETEIIICLVLHMLLCWAAMLKALYLAKQYKKW